MTEESSQDENEFAAAATELIAALSREADDLRVVFAHAVAEFAVLTGDLHVIASTTSRRLATFRASHPLKDWRVIYQPDGAKFVATAPSPSR